jgi:hypothetical protein
MSNLINGFCLLTAQADVFTVTLDLLTTAPNGILALEGNDLVTGFAQAINVIPTDLSGAFVTLSQEQLAIG